MSTSLSARALALAFLCAVLAHGAKQYKIDTIAGTSYTGDGKNARAAVLVQPQTVAVNRDGVVFFADSGDHRVRKVVAGIISTVAGTGVAGYKGDGGPATQAQLKSPYGLAFDRNGNLYIADLGNAVVRCILPDGTIITVAGGGEQVPDGKGPISSRQAKLNQPRDLAVDKLGNLIISDFGANQVYEMNPAGALSLIAGTGEFGVLPSEGTPALQAPLAGPAGVSVDEFRNIYVADSANRRVRRITSGQVWTLSDKDRKQLDFGTPTGVALDSTGQIFVADGGTRVTALSPMGVLSSLPIGGNSVAVSSMGEVYTTVGRQVKGLIGNTLEEIAGIKAGAGSGDGRPATEWRFVAPTSVVRDDLGVIYIADSGNGRVRRISPTGELSTLTTQIDGPVGLALDSQSRLYVADKTTGIVHRIGLTGRPEIYVQGSENRPMRPTGIAFDSRDMLYIADKVNHVIRRVNMDGSLVLMAGGGRDPHDAPALLAQLKGPTGIAVHPITDDVWFTEADSSRVRVLTATGNVKTVSGLELKQPGALRIDAEGYVYVSDTLQHRVIRIAPDGSWLPLAGSGDRGFGGDDGPALAALLDTPGGIELEPEGTILIADTANNRIRRLTPMANTPIDPEGPPPGQVEIGVLVAKHAATLKEQPLAPGQLAILTSEDLPAVELAVDFGGLRGTVISSAAGSLMVQVPWTAAVGKVAIKALAGEAVVAEGIVDIASASPGVITQAGGTGQAAAVNDDGTLNSVANPAGRGSIVALYLTGEGVSTSGATAQIGGYPCEVVWAGLAPGLPGLWQMNVRTPSGYAPGGVQSVSVVVGGVRTQAGVTLVIR